MDNESDLIVLNRFFESAKELSEETYSQLFRMYSQIPNTQSRRSEKCFALKSLGIDGETIERMCKPKEYTREEIDAGIRRETLKMRRELKKWDRKRKKEEAEMYK